MWQAATADGAMEAAGLAAGRMTLGEELLMHKWEEAHTLE